MAALVASKPPAEARALVADLIVDEIARVLRLPRDDIGRSVPLAEIGLDSLMAVELGLGLEARFVLAAPLSASASSFSVNELADHLAALAAGTAEGDEAITREMVHRHLGAAGIAEITDDPAVLDAAAARVRTKSRALKGVLD